LATVFIPSALRQTAGGASQVSVPGATVREVIRNLEERHPGLKTHLVENGKLKPNISVFVDGEPGTIGLLEPVGNDSEVHFIPAIAGG
jgi:molybdopterin synthase sulfur carrier subunit